MPEGLTFEEAVGYSSVVETALRIIRQVGVQAGQTLLASGAGRLGRDPRARRADRGSAEGDHHRRSGGADARCPVLGHGRERLPRPPSSRKEDKEKLHIPVEKSYTLAEAAAAHA
jgi:hypothetical protein